MSDSEFHIPTDSVTLLFTDLEGSTQKSANIFKKRQRFCPKWHPFVRSLPLEMPPMARHWQV